MHEHIQSQHLFLKRLSFRKGLRNRKEMDVHIDELLKEYDDYVSSNPRNNVVNAKGKAWCSTLLKELRKSKVNKSRYDFKAWR